MSSKYPCLISASKASRLVGVLPFASLMMASFDAPSPSRTAVSISRCIRTVWSLSPSASVGIRSFSWNWMIAEPSGLKMW